jgi:hypothetical protein
MYVHHTYLTECVSCIRIQSLSMSVQVKVSECSVPNRAMAICARTNNKYYWSVNMYVCMHICMYVSNISVGRFSRQNFYLRQEGGISSTYIQHGPIVYFLLVCIHMCKTFKNQRKFQIYKKIHLHPPPS